MNKNIELELREKDYEMWLEGTADEKPTIEEIKNEVEKNGVYYATNIEIDFDDMFGFYRFNEDIVIQNKEKIKKYE